MACLRQRLSGFPALKKSTDTILFATILEMPPRCDPHESVRNFLDCSYGLHRIPPDWSGPENFQQPPSYARIAWSARRSSACHHVHSPGETPTQTCFHCTFLCTNPAELGHSPPKTVAQVRSSSTDLNRQAGGGDFRKPLDSFLNARNAKCERFPRPTAAHETNPAERIGF